MTTTASTSASLLAPWTRRLHHAERLRVGAARADGYASLRWREADARLRWLGLRVHPTSADDATSVDALEFLLLLQRLLHVDETLCDDHALSWLSDHAIPSSNASCVPPRRRYEDPCCLGGCLLSGANATPRVAKTKPLKTLGVIVDVGGEMDAAFFTTLQQLSSGYSELREETGLSDAFKSLYTRLAPMPGAQLPVVELHVRLSSLKPSPESLRVLMATLTLWQISPPQGFRISGVDVAAACLADFLGVTPVLPFRQLFVCASSSKASRYDPLATPTKPLDDAIVRQLLVKSHGFLEELELCNVTLANFDCVIQSSGSDSKRRLRKMRLREFSMGVVSDGGIFAALREPSHIIYQTLEELEIRQAVHSAGGLSMWLEREAGAMLLKNDRLTRCVIHQACSMYPSTTHKGFSQTRGREVRLTLAPRNKLAFLGASPIKLPRELAQKILGMAERRAVRDAEMHYEPIEPDQLVRFMRDLDTWKPKPTGPQCVSALPYGSYYF